MLTINAIDLSKQRNAEFIQFNTDFLTIINNNDKAKLKVEDEYKQVDDVLKVIKSLFKRDQGSNITPIIEELDQKRDAAVVGIWMNIESYTYHYEDSFKNASNTLLNKLKVFESATNIVKTALPAETAIINSLINDLTVTDELKNALKTLSLENWVKELKKLNDDLAQKYIERTVEIGGSNSDNIKDKRIEANAKYFSLRDMLQSQAVVAKGVAPFDKTINELNALILQYNTILINRAPADTPKDNTNNIVA